MKKTAFRTNIPVLLDRIGVRPDTRLVLAKEAVPTLSQVDWLVLSGWDVAATLGPDFGRLDLQEPGTITVSDTWGKREFIAFLEDAAGDPASKRAIQYQGANVGIRLDTAATPRPPAAPAMHDPAALLLALQIMRDDLNTLLFASREVWDAELPEFATACGIALPRFQRLAAWYPSAEEYFG